MKKTVRVLALALVLVMMVATFASCGKPSGKYVNGAFYFEFSGKDVKASIAGLSIDGTYEIKDGKIYLTYDIAGVSMTKDFSYEKNGDTITIGGVEYTKAK